MSSFTHQSLAKKVFIGGVIIISIGLLFNLYKLSTHPFSTQQLEEEVSLLHTEVESLQKENSQEFSTFQKESSVRNELNMKKEGEIILQIPIPSTEPLSTSLPPEEKISAFQQWLQLLF